MVTPTMTDNTVLSNRELTRDNEEEIKKGKKWIYIQAIIEQMLVQLR
jgi:hypothetical protein